MKHTILLREKPALVKGHITIDYTRDGRVLERIEGDNRCFDSSFNAVYNWANDVLNGYSATESANLLRLYTDPAPANPDLPYCRASAQLGYGSKGQPASGTTRGAWNAQKSYDNKVINSGNGVSFKWAYDWGVTQMLNGQIRSLGIGHGGEQSTLFLNRAQRTYLNANAWVMKGYVGFRVYANAAERLVNRANIKTGTVLADINIASKVKTDVVSGDNWSIGADHDTGRMYVMLYNTNAAQAATRRILYEFADDTFASLLNTYNISALTVYPSEGATKGFAVYKKKMYIPNAAISMYDYVANTAPTTYPAPIAGSFAHDGLLVKDQYLIRSRGNTFCPVFNMETNTYHSECLFTRSIGGQSYASFIEPLISYSPVVFASGNGYLPFYVLQTMSLFKVPDGAPERPEESGVSIDYQIDVIYAG